MPDELSPLVQAASVAQGDADRNMAVRVRAWFLEAWTSKLWSDFRREGDEDEGFYAGGEDQWSYQGSKEELRRLQGLKRAAVSINQTQEIVDVLTGFEQQNRFDLKAQPQGDEDEEDARLFTWLLKDVQEKADVHALSSEVFEDGLIRGLGAVEVGIDWTGDPISGEIIVGRLEPGRELLWDPWSKDWRDFKDCRYMIRYKQAFLDDLKAQYAEHAAAIEAAADRLDFASMEDRKTTDGPAADAYGDVRNLPNESSAPTFYDAKSRQALVLEAWYQEYEPLWVVMDKDTGQVIEAENGEIARSMAAADPKRLTAVRRLRRVVKMAVVLPATMQTLETDDTPYENDQQAYPFVVYWGKRKREKVYGIVRNLKDPQRVLNKRESQILDILIQYGNLRPMYETGTLENPKALEDQWATSPIVLRPGHQLPGWFAPPLSELFRVLTLEGDRHKLFMRESSGISSELLGQQPKDMSGIAIARIQAQGQIIATVWFDHLRQFRKALGQRLARRIQQVYTSERVWRLTNDVGEPITLRLNPLEFKGKTRDEMGRLQSAGTDGRRAILRDVSALKYDIVISEAPATPSMRAMSLLAVLEILRTIPALADVFLDKVVELADLPDKAELLRRVRALQAPPAPPRPSGTEPPGPAGIPTGVPAGMPVVSPEIRAGVPAA